MRRWHCSIKKCHALSLGCRDCFESIDERSLRQKQNINCQIIKLSGHGKISIVKHNDEDLNYLVMDWSGQERIIEVPLMGCTYTVNVRSMGVIEDQKPEELFEWTAAVK